MGEPAVRQRAEDDDVAELEHGVRPERVERDRVAEQVTEPEPLVREQVRVQPVELRQLVEHLGRPGEHHRRGHRTDRHARQGRGEQPDRRQPEHRQRHVEREQDGPSGVGPSVDLRAREQGHRADREQHGADRGPDQDDEERRGEAERHRPRVLDEDEPHAAGRGHEQVADGAVAGLARDGVTRDHAHGERQEQRDRHGQRGERHEQPVVRDVAEERRTAGVVTGRDPDGDGDEDRHEGERPEHRPRAAASEDEGELGPEECEGALAGTRGGADVVRLRVVRRHGGGVRLRHRSPLR
ncbi:hypothetical protein QE359_003502 [Curtobacterium sp. SORGH_AS776]|nr:hypothetical protein [Curtobacterium sp. SORGH_AS_0776]